jgi:hypothetical protein
VWWAIRGQWRRTTRHFWTFLIYKDKRWKFKKKKNGKLKINKKRTTFVGTWTSTFAEKFSVHCEKQNKNSLVFSLDTFSALVWIWRLCNWLDFECEYPGRQRSARRLSGNAIVTKSRMKLKNNPPHNDEIARCWPNKVQSRFQGLPLFCRDP